MKLTTPETPLESNVEIVCQLPDKKLSTIELFSGGEKAMISIALLFAILQVKPPAFCILDEIEASLVMLDEGKIRLSVKKIQKDKEKEALKEVNKNSDESSFNESLREQLKS